jgi:zinc transporter ZupT
MKSVENFEAAGYDGNESLQYSFLGFFAGSLSTHLLDVILEMISAHYHLNIPTDLGNIPNDLILVEKMDPIQIENHCKTDDISTESDKNLPEQPAQEIVVVQPSDLHVATDLRQDFVPGKDTNSEDKKHNKLIANEPRELLRMGLFSAVIIFLHNLPEGLATYVSVIADPYAGAAVAFAIALHNIPEVRAALQSSPAQSSTP